MELRPALLAACIALGVRDAYASRPLVDFQLNCMGCHLADGSGQPGRVPSMRRSIALLSGSPAGRNYLIRVPGVSESTLSDVDTAILLNWMVHNLSDLPVPRGFVPYTTAEVRRWRRHPLTDPLKTRAALMRAARSAEPLRTDHNPSRAGPIASRSTARSPI